MLLRTIRNRSLILANTGSERSNGTSTPLIATKAADGVRIDGRCEYLSLSSVADIVLFKAQLADSNHAVLCAADLRASTVRIGPWKFSGDDGAVGHVTGDVRRPSRAGWALPDRAGRCRTGLHHGLPEIVVSPVHRGDLSRASRASARHVRLPETPEHSANRSEVARLRQQSLQLLDDIRMGADVGPLTRTTAALKLRVSMMAQTTAAALRSRGLAAEAGGLGYIKSQPTADAEDPARASA